VGDKANAVQERDATGASLVKYVRNGTIGGLLARIKAATQSTPVVVDFDRAGFL